MVDDMAHYYLHTNDIQMIDVCWKIWAQDSHVHHGKLKEEGFYELLGKQRIVESFKMNSY